MNNKLIADIYKNGKRNDLLKEIVPKLETLVKNSDTFTKKESVTALNKVRDSLVLLRDELNSSYVKAKGMRKILRNSCTHEIIIKKSNYYECVICGECFKLDDINFNCFLVENLEECSMLYYIISCIINDIAMNDEDVFSVFEDMLYDKYKNYGDSDNLLVYRRSR